MPQHHGVRLLGRRRECGALDDLLSHARSGESRVLVLRGEPGIGKTALLDYAAGCASDCRVDRVGGDESEMELAFAGLHLLCAPMLAMRRGVTWRHSSARCSGRCSR